ncbi:MAG TPA: GWxTD domain-containing protein [Candidatus Polarisedimenticolia bacterium]|nr:GWxTD domain-containing protein [Candidatus Polarisedimenticolia bacterium]
MPGASNAPTVRSGAARRGARWISAAAPALSLMLLVWAGAEFGSAQAARRKIDYLDKPIPEWREGPIRYIITKWEDEEYKALESDDDRARFIENFWRRRDQTQDTPGNEYRAEFWKRVRDANRLYAEETSRDGWRTDMGKIHILRGPPDDISRDLVAEGHRGTVIWTYRNSGVPGIGPNVVVAFARDPTGEFRLSTQPSKDADPKQGMPLPYQPPMGTMKFARTQELIARETAAQLFNLTDPLIRQAGGPASSTSLEMVTQLAKLQQPPKEWEIRETVTTQEFFGAVPIRARADFFRTTSAKTLVVLTAGVRSSAVHYRRKGGREVPDVVFYGRVLDLTGNDLVASLERDDDFDPAPENAGAGLDDDLLFQARALLDPGSYKVVLSVLDRAGGRAGTYQTPLTVPDLGTGALSLSSLMLVRSIEPAAETAEEGAVEIPFAMGNLRLVPRLGQTFAPGQNLGFYYQVYGAAADPASGDPRLDVDYGFFTVSAGETQDIGHVAFADQKRESHGYMLSLKDWPPGPYLLRVSVTDRVAQATASRELVFEVR